MANFTFEKYNSMPEQVEENKENIKKLCAYIKDAYKTSLTLNDTDTTISISDTNADASTVDGWLFDANGKLFKITSGDGTNLLIDFYSNFKGADGRDGADDIDDNITANNKLWSSQKTSNKIDLISDKGIYYTFVQPTLVDSQYELNTSDLENPNQYTYQKYNDIIVYIDGDGKVKEFYNCIGVLGDFSKIFLEKVGEIGGKQLYRHNVSLRIYDNNMSKDYIVLSFLIDNDDEEEFNYTKFSDLIIDTLGENSQRGIDNGFFSVNGYYDNNGGYKIEGIVTGNNAFAWQNDTIWAMYSSSNNIAYTNISGLDNNRYTFTWKDNVKPL